MCKHKSTYERKQHLDSHKYNEQCDICMENSQTILEQKEKVDKELDEKESQNKELKSKLSELEIKIDSLKPRAHIRLKNSNLRDELPHEPNNCNNFAHDEKLG